MDEAHAAWWQDKLRRIAVQDAGLAFETAVTLDLELPMNDDSLLAATLPPTPMLSPVEEKITKVLDAMADAVVTVIGTNSPSRFAQASRFCSLAQKLSVELVQNVSQAKNLQRAAAHQIGQIGHYIPGADDGFVGAPGYDMPMPAMVPDAATLQNNLLMMAQEYFQDLKKQKETPPAALPQTRGDLYYEMNQALRVRDELRKDLGDKALLDKVERQIESLIIKLAEGDPIHDNTDQASIAHVVPTELLRGHPPRAGFEPGDAGDPRGPVLHREDCGEGADRGGQAHGDHQEALG